MQLKQTFQHAALCGMLAAPLAPALAQDAAPTASVEIGALRHTLSDGYGSWTHQFVRGTVQAGADDTWKCHNPFYDRRGIELAAFQEF